MPISKFLTQGEDPGPYQSDSIIFTLTPSFEATLRDEAFLA